MTHNIIDSKLLIGFSRNEVTELLGNDYTEPFDKAIAYNIHRPKILFSIDHDVLIIYFDDNGLVNNVYEFALK